MGQYKHRGRVILVEGETTHTSIVLPAPIHFSELTVVVDLSSLGGASANVGIDNLAFGQVLRAESMIVDSEDDLGDANSGGGLCVSALAS